MMRKIFAFALAALLLLFAAGCQGLPGNIVAPPTTPPVFVTAAPPTAPPLRTWNGIAEGDVVPGELTFYCSYA